MPSVDESRVSQNASLQLCVVSVDPCDRQGVADLLADADVLSQDTKQELEVRVSERAVAGL